MMRNIESLPKYQKQSIHYFSLTLPDTEKKIAFRNSTFLWTGKSVMKRNCTSAETLVKFHIYSAVNR